jgi:hypothetical protein
VRKILLVISIMSICGCSALVPWSRMTGQKEYRDGARGFTADLPVDWMRDNRQRYFLITRDGAVLNHITVERRRIDEKLEFTKRTFSADMLPQDLAEIEIDNEESNGQATNFVLLSNEPATISGQPAFSIHYTYMVASGGLNVEGILSGFIYKGWVYRIRYEAAEQNYFKKHIGDFEKFIGTFRLI